MGQHDGLDAIREQMAKIEQQGLDSGGLEDDPETDEQRKARRDFLAQYDDPEPSGELDEDGDLVEADPDLLAAAQTLSDPDATAAEVEESRQLLLDSVGGFDSDYNDEDDVPTTRAGRVAEMAEAVKIGMLPDDPYSHDGEVDDAVSTQAATKAIAIELAIQQATNKALGTPGYGDSGPRGPRSPEEVAAIDAVRAAMLRAKGIEPSDLMNPPEVDADDEKDLASQYADWDEELGLEPGTSAAQAAQDEADFDAGGLD